MAIQQEATVEWLRPVGAHTVHVRLHLDTPLPFAGGQYVIVDSGQVKPNGKAAKRAYSILSKEQDRSHLELLVKRIGNDEVPDAGIVSRFLHASRAGARLRFTGPWGKFVAAASPGPSLVVASDTGITASLALLNGERMRPSLPQTTLIWLRCQPLDFVPDAFVREALPPALGLTRFIDCPPLGAPERLTVAREVAQEELRRARPERVYASGDGAINYALLSLWQSAGIACTKDSLESFFNLPGAST